MIHTMTVQYQLDEATMRLLLQRLKFSQRQINSFLYAAYEDAKPLYYDKNNQLGIDEVSFCNHYIYDSKSEKSKRIFIVYVRLEPLVLIKKERYIKLFECTEDNKRELYMAFGNYIAGILNVKDEDDPLAPLVDFYEWDANRVDYTVDIRMNSHDEVLLFMNIAKWGFLSNKYTKLDTMSNTYDKAFFDNKFKCGNKTWEITLYDKQRQIASKEDYPEAIKPRLIKEAENIVRLEYQRKNPGTKAAATDFESRKIYEFLNEDLGRKWLYECYEDTIGYEDFYVKYHADKAIDKAFPMNASEIREDNKKKRKAEAAGKTYKPEKHSKKAKNLMSYMVFITSHNGINSAFKYVADKFKVAIVALRNITNANDLKLIVKGKEEASDDVKKIIDNLLEKNKIPKDFLLALPELMDIEEKLLTNEDAKSEILYYNTASKAIHPIFRRYNNKIRTKVGISPIMIPDAWLYKKKNLDGKPLNIPRDIFKNPVQRPQD